MGSLLNIQIFEKAKSFDTKKAERYFGTTNFPSSPSICALRPVRKEFDRCASGGGCIDNLIDWDSKDPDILILHTEDSRAKEDKVFDRPELMRLPLSETAGRPPWVTPRRSGKHGNNESGSFRWKGPLFRYKDHFFVKSFCKERGKVVCYEKSPLEALETVNGLVWGLPCC